MDSHSSAKTRQLKWVETPVEASVGITPDGWQHSASTAALLADAEAVAQSAGAAPLERIINGGPGTGKTELLATTGAALIAGGIAAERVMVIASSPRSVRQLRRKFDAACAARSSDRAALRVVPQIRTVHSLAFAVLGAAAAKVGVPAPRLLTGAEHDAIFREALIGDAADAGEAWPDLVRPALTTRGFARELRDFVLRTSERSVEPQELMDLGEKYDRPSWVAAARFAERHEQEMELRHADRPAAEGFPTSLDVAQLVGRAIEEYDQDPGLAQGPVRIDALLVDDAQLIDPIAGELLARVAERARAVVITADPDSAVFRFRGASEKFMEWLRANGAETLSLEQSWRAEEPMRAARVLAQRLPGSSAWRTAASHAMAGEADRESQKRGDDEATAGTVAGAEGPQSADSPLVPRSSSIPQAAWHTAISPAEEAAGIADYLLRMHLRHEVPWENMAVVMRSVGSGAELLQRTFDAAGIPVVDAGAEVPPAENPLVCALLDIAESVVDQPNTEEVRRLLVGPLGKADPADFRDLRRVLRQHGIGGEVTEDAEDATPPEPRSSLEMVRDLVLGEADPEDVLPEHVPDRLLTPLQRIRRLRAVVQDSLAAKESVEHVLWNLWHATKRAHSLRAIVAEGGVAGRTADRAADAVLDLFDHAADFVEQMPRGSLSEFIRMLRQEELPAPRRSRRAVRRAVNLLSAHNCVASEFDVVVVAGVQDGTWPATRRRFGLFELELLVDLLDNPEFAELSEKERQVTAATAAAADERRLAVLACSRARKHVLVTAVDTPDGDYGVSPYLDELRMAGIPEWAPASATDLLAGHRVYTSDALIAELRAQLQNEPESARSAAAGRILASLKRADIRGADPAQWYRTRSVSSMTSPFPAPRSGPRARLSPSAMTTLVECPLSWFIGRMGSSGSMTPLLRGTAVHLAVQALGNGVPREDVVDALKTAWPAITDARGWLREMEIAELAAMVDVAAGWIAKTGPHAGLEEPITLDLCAPPEREIDGKPACDVRIMGRVDRIDTAGRDSFRAVDFKTGSTAESANTAERNRQLACYQLALRAGGIGKTAQQVPPRIAYSDLVAQADAENNGEVDPDEADAGTPATGAIANHSAGAMLVYVSPKIARKDGPAVRHQAPMGDVRQLEIVQQALLAGAESLGPDYRATPGPGCDTCAAKTMCPTQTAGKQVGR